MCTFCTGFAKSFVPFELRSRRRAADAGIREMKVSMLHSPTPTQKWVHELYCTCAYTLVPLIEDERSKGAWGWLDIHELFWGGRGVL